MTDKQIQALARKNAAKAQHATPARERFGKTYDTTLPGRRRTDQHAIEDAERSRRFFKDMQERDF